MANVQETGTVPFPIPISPFKWQKKIVIPPHVLENSGDCSVTILGDGKDLGTNGKVENIIHLIPDIHNSQSQPNEFKPLGEMKDLKISYAAAYGPNVADTYTTAPLQLTYMVKGNNVIGMDGLETHAIQWAPQVDPVTGATEWYGTFTAKFKQPKNITPIVTADAPGKMISAAYKVTHDGLKLSENHGSFVSVTNAGFCDSIVQLACANEPQSDGLKKPKSLVDEFFDAIDGAKAEEYIKFDSVPTPLYDEKEENEKLSNKEIKQKNYAMYKKKKATKAADKLEHELALKDGKLIINGKVAEKYEPQPEPVYGMVKVGFKFHCFYTPGNLEGATKKVSYCTTKIPHDAVALTKIDFLTAKKDFKQFICKDCWPHVNALESLQ